MWSAIGADIGERWWGACPVNHCDSSHPSGGHAMDRAGHTVGHEP